MTNKKVLSASRMGTLQKCSWSYWCNYHLKIPQAKNDGQVRGTVCHLIFECLLKKRHKKHFDKIMEVGNLSESAAILRLIEKGLKRDEFYSQENFDLCCKMIFVGLNLDFFGGTKLAPLPEEKFLLEEDKPEYKIMGYIDKVIRDPKKKTIKIVDYKTSKRKFKGEELTSNLQAMAYTLAAQKLWPEYNDITVEFQFVKFPRQPIQQIKVTQKQLDGFEHYMEYIYEIINDFSEESAMTNYAAHSKTDSWLCKAGKTWRCPYLDRKEYYVLLDESDAILKSSFKDDLSPKEGERSEKRVYSGCPAHKQGDSFGF